ncbi:hypothetical protein K1719_023630 [Acacia pycnantha]|nr:hypothetical protein K1719_023630 [Acacia pycnantha]
MSTLTTPPPNTFSARDDVPRLHKALKKGIRCKTSVVIEILAHRDSAQRDLILQEYESAYSNPLPNVSVQNFMGISRKQYFFGWMNLPIGMLRSLSKVYHTRLERDIEDYLSVISKGPEFDQERVEKDAMNLYKAGEGKMLGTNEKTFIRIFSDRSRTHLAAIAKAYERNNGHSLEKALKKETSGYFERASSPFFDVLLIHFCTSLSSRKAMKGLGTDDSRLIRVIVTRTEIDMEQIKEAYLSRYEKPLANAVRSDTSGHYKDFLLSLIGSDDMETRVL